MRYLQAIWAQSFGLFVDDVPLTAGILAWLAITCVLLPWAGLRREILAIPMLLGLAAILLASALQRARRQPPSATKP